MRPIENPEIRAEIYILRFKDAKGKPIAINNLRDSLESLDPPVNSALLPYVLDRLLAQADGYQPPKYKSSKTFRIQQGELNFASHHSEIFGAIRGGHVGIAGEIESFSTPGAATEFTANDVSARKHFFTLQLPENRDFGMLIIQSYLGLSFVSQLKAFVLAAFQDLKVKVDFSRWVPNDVRAAYKKGIVKEIKVSSPPRRKDRSQNQYARYAISESTVRSVLTTTGNFGTLENFVDIFNPNVPSDVDAKAVYGDFGDEDAVIQLKVRYGGRDITYPMVDGNFMPIIVLSESLFDTDGKIVEDKIRDVFRERLAELDSELLA